MRYRHNLRAYENGRVRQRPVGAFTHSMVIEPNNVVVAHSILFGTPDVVSCNVFLRDFAIFGVRSSGPNEVRPSGSVLTSTPFILGEALDIIEIGRLSYICT
jgi:hypothetical protein